MSKTIKLEDKVYDRLTEHLRVKETYSQVVERFLDTFDRLGQLQDVLEGAARFRAEQHGKIQELAPK